MKKSIIYILIMSLLISVFLLSGCSQAKPDVDALIKEAEEKGLKAVVSRCIVSDDGTVFYNYENKPVAIKWYDEKHYLTDKLTTGDLVLIIGEADFSGNNGHYLRFKDCKLIEEGTVNDIPDDMLEPLIEKGFVDDILREKNGITLDTSGWQEVYYNEGLQSISLKLPPDWEYEVERKCSRIYECVFALKIRPKGQEGSIAIAYCNTYGICGTGLTTEALSAGPYKISAATYGSYGNWDYINISDVAGNYDIVSYGAHKWYDEYKDVVENIFTTLVISKDIISYDEALDVAYKLLCRQKSPEYDSYDGLFLDKEKCWRFNFSYTPTEKVDTWERVQIKVYADGTAEITKE
ncbi:MAG: hypothetical protein J6M16_08570 [Clostridia bacterium]|nr:hypothetical protein [Clostridia bacterium]